MTRRQLQLAIAVVFVLGLPGCGNLTAGGFGEVTVDMVGDGPGGNGQGGNGPGGSSPAATPPAEPDGPRLNQGGGAFQGEVTVELRVLLRDASGEWVEVTEGAQRVQVDAAGASPAEFARRPLAEGTYDRVRVEFLLAEVLVTSAPPGQGVPEGVVVVDFEGEPVVMLERPLTVQVGADGQRLRVNLRSGAWLRAAVMGRVPASNFRNAVRVFVVGEGD